MIADALKANAEANVAALNAHPISTWLRAIGPPDIVGMFHGAPNINSPAEDLAMTKQPITDPAFKLATGSSGEYRRRGERQADMAVVEDGAPTPPP